MIDTKALREKVLDLAIRGKLVPQDPNDEPASVLLERIRMQKEEMVKEGKLKAKDIKNDTIIFKSEDNLHYEKFQDGTVKCIEDEIPFEVPEGWEWSRFSSVTINRDSERKPISLKDRTDIEKIYDYYGASGAIDKVSGYLFDERLLLIGEDGANLITRSKPIAFFATGKYWVNNHAHCIDSTDKQYLDFICLYINSINLEKFITGAAQPKMNQDNMNSILVPFPPLNEQRSIVKFIVQMDAIIGMIRNNGNELAQLITDAKSQILDLAIRGKLVPQDPDDEPASVLLERIRAEKEELIKQGKIKRDKKESIIFKGDDNSYYRLTSDNKSYNVDLPFDVPENWTWCNLSMIGTTNVGLTYKPCEIVADGTMVLRSSNIINGKIDLTDLVRVNSTIRDNQYIEENDILICARNGSKALVGKCAIFKGVSEKTSFGAFMAIYRSKFFKYVYYFLNSEIFRNTFNNDDTKQINQLTQDMIKNTVIPLPPFAEQKRIVQSIETVFAYLDEISNSIS